MSLFAGLPEIDDDGILLGLAWSAAAIRDKRFQLSRESRDDVRLCGCEVLLFGDVRHKIEKLYEWFLADVVLSRARSAPATRTRAQAKLPPTVSNRERAVD